jgi:hypothetical protein
MDLQQQVREPTHSAADAEESVIVVTVEEGEGATEESATRETCTGGVHPRGNLQVWVLLLQSVIVLS